MDREGDERSHAASALAVFSFMWAMAALFHQSSYALWLASPSDIAIAVLAFFVLWRPASLGRMGALVLVQGWTIWVKLPGGSNHSLLAFFVALAFLLALGRGAWAARGRAIDPSGVYLDFAPAARLALLALYFWAVFHKLNRSYFDPTVSCAATMVDALAGGLSLPSPGTAARYGAIVGSLAAEVAIAVLLCIRRCWAAGIGLGALFHVGLALSPYPSTRVYNFTSLLLALYLLFAPPGLVHELRASWEEKVSRWLRARPLLREGLRWGLLLGLFLLLCAVAYWPKSPGWRRVLVDGSNLVWMAYASVAAVSLVAAWRRGKASLPAGRHPLAVRPLLAVAPVLTLLNGLTPYVGLKTELSFAMYSNLRTEGGATNHFLVRKPFYLFGYQDDLVTFVRSDAPKLEAYAEEGYRLTWFEFRRFLEARPKIRVTYRRGSEEERSIERPADDPRLLERPAPWQRKVLTFRPARVEDPVYCIH